MQFGAQPDGVSFGRSPDGANDFYTFTSRTPGTNNSAILVGDIVINELMYNPISGNDDEQYIELFNQGTNTVNLAGWQFSAGVAYTFPSVTIAPSGYLVVGRNTVNLLAKYPNLNSGNTVGNFSGKVSHNGEQVVLSQPQTLNTNAAILVAADSVNYDTGGRWGQWSSGGGSSLELKDPRANHRLAANWADSDDSQKSVWTNIEATGPLPVPNTPGAANSRAVTNAGPAIYNVTHNPPLPAAGQPAVVSVQVQDPNGVQNLRLNYRIDPGTAFVSVLMKDDGTGGDALARDVIFSATIPSQNANTLAAFYISATDSNAVVSRFPSLLTDNSPTHECLAIFGDGNPGGSFGSYHLWISQSNVTRWASLSDMSNESHDCTMVNGNRVIYNLSARFAGSPYHQGFDTPSGNLCHYKWIFNDDDKFLGATSFNKIHQPGNGAGDDASIQREQLANTFLRTLSVPWLNRRYVAVYVNGNRRGSLMEDTQTPDGDVVKEHYPNNPNRALGLLATSSTKGTAFGVRFVNGTGMTLNRINVQLTAEVWRQSNLARRCSFFTS